MQTYHVETKIAQDGSITIKALPFRKGEEVEVIVRRRKGARQGKERYPLRGKPVRYVDPFESVAGKDWDILQ